MPNFDNTGPEGKGPQSGRGQGNCQTVNNGTLMNPQAGFGRGRGGRCRTNGGGNGRGSGRGQGGRGMGRGNRS